MTDELRELAGLVAPLVLNLLLRGGAAEPGAYSTRSGEEPPDFKGRARRRIWCRTAPTIPGAIRDGRRWWVVPRSAYESWRASQAPNPLHAAPSSTWDPDSVVRSLGRVPGARKARA